jgi:PPK2 family polyphosphate:nucleotide phosphotransferase
MDLTKIANRFRIEQGDKFRLSQVDTSDSGGASLDKDNSQALLESCLKRIGELQDVLYAESRHAVLAVLQGMDTAGKDGIIEHVIHAINPQGCEVHAFKQPNAEELEHTFLWRAQKRLPARGHVGVFNRSYYEDVVVVRVHPEFLDKQNLPEVSKDIWQQRFEDIRGFERHLVRNGTLVLKFFLHVSQEEQRKRLLARLDDPKKRWKFSMGDIAERALWPKYMDANEDMIRATSTPEAPWYVVPADKKWFARLVVASAMLGAMEGMGLKYPKVSSAALDELTKVRKALEDQK